MTEGELELAEGGVPVAGEARSGGPVIVVTAVHLSAEARSALAEKLGPGHIVRDIRDAGNTADIVLVPAMSGHGIGGLRSMFPGAEILAGEFVDDQYGVDVAGPLRRALETGVDGYFVAPDLAGVAQVTRDAALGKPVGVLEAGGAVSRPSLETNGLQQPRRGTVHVVDHAEVRIFAEQLNAIAIDDTEWIDRLELTGEDQHHQLASMLSSLTHELLARGVDVVRARPRKRSPPRT